MRTQCVRPTVVMTAVAACNPWRVLAAGTCALSVLHDTLHGNVRVALLSEHTSAAATAYRQQYPGAGSTGWNCLAEHVVLEGGSLTEPSAGSIQVIRCPAGWERV